jgi:parvulin-like peptidyl-prolyl isomerase
MKKMRIIAAGFLALALTGAARAQEGELKPVDQVIARVNSSIILKSAYDRAQMELLESLKQQGLKDAELEKKFNEFKPMVLDQLIDTELLVQRGRELSIDVKAQVNQHLLRLMKDNNLTSLEDLETKMREVGIDILEVRRILETRFISDAVRNKDVFAKIFFGLTEKEKREFYEKHKEAFSTPGEVTLSRIFVAFGKDEAAALTRAQDITAQARSGAADFAALANRHSEEDLGKKGGVIGALKIPDLSTEVRTAVGTAKVGTVTDPIKLDNGFAIFRVDARQEPVVKPFDEKEVQEAVAQQITYERGETEMEKYLEKLRGDAFIEVAPSYQLANSKIKSNQIKRIPFSPEDRKKRNKDKDKDKKEDAKGAEKTEKTEKTAATVKP